MDIIQAMRDRNAGIIEAIGTAKAKRLMEGRVCRYLVVSEPIYRLLRLAVAEEFDLIEEASDFESFNGMDIIRLDDDYELILLIG